MFLMVKTVDMNSRKDGKSERFNCLPSKSEVTESPGDNDTDSSISNNSGPHDPHRKATAKQKKRKWKWPKGKPKRPLTAYNYFFQHERDALKAAASTTTENIKSSSTESKTDVPIGIGFLGLTQKVAAKWKTLEKSERKIFEDLAAMDKRRYFSEVAVWSKAKKKEGSELERPPLSSTPQTLSRVVGVNSQPIHQAFQPLNQSIQEPLGNQLASWAQNASVTHHVNIQSATAGPAPSSYAMNGYDNFFHRGFLPAQNAPNNDEHTGLNRYIGTASFPGSTSHTFTNGSGTKDRRIPSSIPGAENVDVDDEFIDFLHAFEKE